MAFSRTDRKQVSSLRRVATLESLSRHPSEIADFAEGLRREGRFKEAMEAIERSLEENSSHARSLLLRARILYQEGQILQALDGLRPLQTILGEDGELKTIVTGLELLWQERISQMDPAFVTAAMAKLLIHQGYLLQAIEIYRQLFLASEEKASLWKEILLLRERMGSEGSREVRRERMSQEIEALDRWIKKQERGS